MPGQFLTKVERERLQSFPEQITPDEIIIFFTLSDQDLALVKKRSGDHNLLGFALQLGTLRYLSFIPAAILILRFHDIKSRRIRN